MVTFKCQDVIMKYPKKAQSLFLNNTIRCIFVSPPKLFSAFKNDNVFSTILTAHNTCTVKSKCKVVRCWIIIFFSCLFWKLPNISFIFIDRYRFADVFHLCSISSLDKQKLQRHNNKILYFFLPQVYELNSPNIIVRICFILHLYVQL